MALVALAISVAGGSAVAQDVELRSISALSGRCLSLTVVGQDITADCDGTLLLMDHVSGRHTVSYVLRRGPSAVHFSGREAAPATSDGGTTIQVDEIILVAPNAKDTVIRGAGECRLGDFSAGAAAISCQFGIENGSPVSATFETDGTAPREVRP